MAFTGGLLVMIMGNMPPLLKKSISILQNPESNFLVNLTCVGIIFLSIIGIFYLIRAVRKVILLIGKLNNYQHVNYLKLEEKLNLASTQKHYYLFLAKSYHAVVQINKEINDRKADSLSQATFFLSYALYSYIGCIIVYVLSGI